MSMDPDLKQLLYEMDSPILDAICNLSSIEDDLRTYEGADTVTHALQDAIVALQKVERCRVQAFNSKKYWEVEA